MADLVDGLRALVAEIVRDEVRRALAEPKRPVEFLSTADGAAFAGVAPGTIRRWIREGRLASHKAGRVVRVSRSDLERLLRDGGNRPAGELSPEAAAARDFSRPTVDGR